MFEKKRGKRNGKQEGGGGVVSQQDVRLVVVVKTKSSILYPLLPQPCSLLECSSASVAYHDPKQGIVDTVQGKKRFGKEGGEEDQGIPRLYRKRR